MHAHKPLVNWNNTLCLLISHNSAVVTEAMKVDKVTGVVAPFTYCG